ncbi:LysM domain-containing protein, partial [Pseudomonas aeruginosa]
SSQQNGQQGNSQNSNSNQQGKQTHTVNGKENLYRIAIQYYGSGSPANVEKIRQANGLNGNNIHNGQTLVIP